MRETDAPVWDIVIRPQQAWWKPDLKEFWHYRDLLMLLVRRDLTSQYKQTILGPAWLVLQPLLTTITYTVMFAVVARLPTSGIPPMLFYLSGIVPWTYFSGVVNKTSHLCRQLRRAHQGVLPAAHHAREHHAVHALLVRGTAGAVVLIIGAYAAFGGFEWSPSANLIFLPLVILIMSLLGLGAGVLVSAMTTKYRDLGFLVAFGVAARRSPAQ